MKKTLIALFMLLPFIASAQTTFLTDGITHVIARGYISGDSIHTIGLIDMRDGVKAMDSIAIAINAQDSLRYTVYVVPVGPLGTWNVADSVAGIIPPNVATYYNQGTEGITVIPWFKIYGAIGSNARWPVLRVYVRVWDVGSEVASSGKKFKVRALAYD